MKRPQLIALGGLALLLIGGGSFCATKIVLAHRSQSATSTPENGATAPGLPPAPGEPAIAPNANAPATGAPVDGQPTPPAPPGTSPTDANSATPQTGPAAIAGAPNNAGVTGTPPAAPAGEETRRAKRGLQFLFTRIGRLEREGENKLTPQQAREILALMTPLRTQPTLTPEEATRIHGRLEGMLTDAQRQEIAQMPMGGRPGGPDGAGGQRPEGMGRPDGEPRPDRGPRPEGGPGPDGERMRPSEDPNANPFNPAPDSRGAERRREQLDAIFALLEAKANG